MRRMEGWDGELIVGNPWSPNCFRNTTSGVMSEDGEPKFTFWVFDNSAVHLQDEPYAERFRGLCANIKSLRDTYVRPVPQVKVKDVFELQEYETQILSKGYEGVMVRSLTGIYKHGRSTLKEGHLMKLKRFADSEAIVLSMEEQMHNTNEKTVNELGNAKRSSHKAGMVGKQTLGALNVRDVHTGVEFDIGTGFDDELRQYFWNNPSLIVGEVVKYKFFPSGSKTKPRFPVYLGLRAAIDR